MSDGALDFAEEFDSVFQSKIVALVVRDSQFVKRTDGLLVPDYFERYAEAAIVNVVYRYYGRYRAIPDKAILIRLIKGAIDSKRIRKDYLDDIKDVLKGIYKADISGREYVLDLIGEFARHQALSGAILESVDHLEKKDFAKVEKMFKQAMSVGAEQFESYDYFDEIETRTQQRLEEKSGRTAPKGVTTGYRKLDKVLYHKGWGKSELSVLMGGPKAGKSMSLVEFSKGAVYAGENVLFVTLEVSREIVADRFDANIADERLAAVRDTAIC